MNNDNVINTTDLLVVPRDGEAPMAFLICLGAEFLG